MDTPLSDFADVRRANKAAPEPTEIERDADASAEDLLWLYENCGSRIAAICGRISKWGRAEHAAAMDPAENPHFEAALDLFLSMWPVASAEPVPVAPVVPLGGGE